MEDTGCCWHGRPLLLLLLLQLRIMMRHQTVNSDEHAHQATLLLPRHKCHVIGGQIAAAKQPTLASYTASKTLQVPHRPLISQGFSVRQHLQMYAEAAASTTTPPPILAPRNSCKLQPSTSSLGSNACCFDTVSHVTLHSKTDVQIRGCSDSITGHHHPQNCYITRSSCKDRGPVPWNPLAYHKHSAEGHTSAVIAMLYRHHGGCLCHLGQSIPDVASVTPHSSCRPAAGSSVAHTPLPSITAAAGS
jgi:hypothetical protein